MVIDTSSEATSAMRHGDRERPEQLPGDAGDHATGRNTATVVRVDAVTAPATSVTEATMSPGVSGSGPVSRRLMFSITTIESSTTRPTATVIAARVKMFSE